MVRGSIARTTIVTLDGEFDLAERGRMDDAFHAALESPLIVLDCERTRYIDSTALGCILRARKAAVAKGSEMIVVAPSPNIRHLFEVCGLAEVVDIRESLADIDGEQLASGGSFIQRIELVSQIPD
jgi:anti-anti-sigma factor